MKYKTEEFKDRAELYLWASEKKDIEYNGKIMKYNKDGYNLALDDTLSLYKKVIYIKTKQYWLWDICNDDGFWYRCNSFLDENGLYSDGKRYSIDWNELRKRKVEDSLLEIEEQL